MSSPSSRQQTLAPLTQADELESMMREVTPPFDEDDLVSESGQQTTSPSHGAVASSNGEANGEVDGISPSSGPLRSNEQCAAQRVADRLNLFPYQKEALDRLVKV